jgi:hypothetical protein
MPTEVNARQNQFSLTRAASINRRRGKKQIPISNSEGVNIYSRRDGDADFKFLARDTVPPYVDNRPMLVAGKPELREYKAVFVVGDQEVSQFSDEITVNCAPLV